MKYDPNAPISEALCLFYYHLLNISTFFWSRKPLPEEFKMMKDAFFPENKESEE